MPNICRLCGNNEDQSIFIFGNEAMNHYIDLKIRVGLDIQIFPDDPLPKHACICCLGKLDEFCTFQQHCRRVQTNLRRLLPERVPFQWNKNCDLHQNPKTSTEDSSAHIEVFETLVDSTDNDVNNPFDLNSSNNGKVEVGKIKDEAHSHENSNNSVHSYNESYGNECDPSGNDSYLINSELLIAPENVTSQAACQLDSYCFDKKEAMAFSTDGFTSESAPEHKYVTVEGVSKVQDNLASNKADLRNTVRGRFETLFVNNDYVTSNSFIDIPEDSLLMEEEILQVSNTVQTTASMLTVAQKGPDDKGFDTFSVNNNLNQNPLQGQSMIPQSSPYLTIANKGRHGNESTDTGSFQVNNSQSSLLMEEHSSKNRYHGTDGTQSISSVIVNNINNNKKLVHCDSAFNTLRHPLLKGKVACKTTSPATDNCLQNISVQEVHDADITQGNGSDSSQESVIITELSLNHPNHVGSGVTNGSSDIGTSHNETSNDNNPRYLLGEVYNTIPQVTGRLMRNTVFDSNEHFINTDSRPLQDMETSGKVSEVIDLVAVTIENEVRQCLQLNTASCSDSNINRETKGHSVIVNSGNSATCVHGIDTIKCIYKTCCYSHPVDKYFNKRGSRFHCLLCEFVANCTLTIRGHICVHLSLKLFECSFCQRKFRSFAKLCSHKKIHGKRDDSSYLMARGAYSCESCSKTFKYKGSLRVHRIRFHVVQQNFQFNTALLSEADIDREIKEYSVIVNSGNSATCVHGIDTRMCVFRRCCESHPFDKYFNTADSRYHCLLCRFVTDGTNLMREHISGHLSLKLFECSICYKKIRSFRNLNPHIKTHGEKADMRSSVHHCRRVQTNLGRPLPERTPFQVQNINCDLHQNPKTSTEKSSAHIEVFETLVDSTYNDVNKPFDLNSSSNGKVEEGKIKVEAHSHENSNNSVNSHNESCGNECDPWSNDPYLINSELLIPTKKGTSHAACQLDSYCQDREDDMPHSADGFTSQSAPENKSVTVEGVFNTTVTFHLLL